MDFDFGGSGSSMASGGGGAGVLAGSGSGSGSGAGGAGPAMAMGGGLSMSSGMSAMQARIEEEKKRFFRAVAAGDFGTVNTMLEGGMRPDVEDAEGFTAAGRAVQKGRTGVLQVRPSFMTS